jgi:putative ABC transport system permease protein
VAVVGRSFARRFWPSGAGGGTVGDVLGKRLRFPLPGSSYSQQWFTVVGIVGDAKYRGLRNDRLDLYISDMQSPYPAHQFVVRTDADSEALVGAIRAQVRAIDRDLPIDDVTVLGDAVEQELANPRFTARLFAAFALTALGLAALGLGTLISWQVVQRTREIGIRIALGATAPQVIRLVMIDNALIVCVGIGAGLGIAAATTAILRTLLFNVRPADPMIMIAAVATAAFVGLASAYFPARRASRVDPLIAVRTE